ncbi:MAG: D-alanyl-D-alanine carboxypeptidase [Oscillospiraceae bacterium]|jgi:D-alanyl-D-alanine carboxypeptidase (penicillin-binding protein 5/6)|nr:D-alanyl-D-alanine carboxypeptidase [Oscillospiraceae bacterium]
MKGILLKTKQALAYVRAVRISAIVLTIAMLAAMGGVPVDAVEEPPYVSASTAILYDPETKTTLFEKDSNTELPIASITKIMTALIVLERCKLNDSVTFKKEWQVEGSSSGFTAGKTYTVRQMLYALMLASGNDTAMGLAEFTAGSQEKFVELMNAKAKSLGLEHTHFANPHGLDAKDHYSTARDMAVLTAAAMENMKFRLIASTKEVRVGGIYFRNHNKLLWDAPGVIGVKTGYTSKAGRTLVTMAERGGKPLIAVTLNDGDDWKDHSNLYNWGYAQ